MSEHTSSRYSRRKEVALQAKDTRTLWEKLEQDENYTGYKYDSSIFADDDFTEDEMERNASWQHASKVIYDMEYGDGAWDRVSDAYYKWNDEKASQALAEWGTGYMGRFNYNLVIMGSNAAQVESDETSPEAKIAFKYMMDAYEHKSMSWAGWGRALAGMSYDPSTYIGLGTAGFILKATTKHTLSKAMLTGAVAMGTEGAIFTYKDNENRQQVNIASGAQDKWDYNSSLISTGIGFGAGAALGKAIPFVGRNIKQWAVNTGRFFDPRTNSTFAKTVTAGIVVGAPAAAIARANYAEEQEEQKQEQIEQQGRQIEDAASEAAADSINNLMEKFKSKNSATTQSDNSAVSSYSSQTPANPLAIAFNNRVNELTTNLNQPIIAINVSEEDALKIRASLDQAS